MPKIFAARRWLPPAARRVRNCSFALKFGQARPTLEHCTRIYPHGVERRIADALRYLAHQDRSACKQGLDVPPVKSEILNEGSPVNAD